MLTLTHVERRLLSEYIDLPGLNLTLAQAARLVGVDAPACQIVLHELVKAGCLAQAASGRYVREARSDDLDAWKRFARRCLASVARISPGTLENRLAQKANRGRAVSV